MFTLRDKTEQDKKADNSGFFEEADACVTLTFQKSEVRKFCEQKIRKLPIVNY